MAVRSKQLWPPSAVNASGSLLYTCPAGETALIKTLSMYNTDVVPRAMGIRLGGNGVNQTVVFEQVPAGFATVLRELFIVLQPGETVHGVTAGTGGRIAGFGAELEGVAD